MDVGFFPLKICIDALWYRDYSVPPTSPPSKAIRGASRIAQPVHFDGVAQCNDQFPWREGRPTGWQTWAQPLGWPLSHQVCMISHNGWTGVLGLKCVTEA